MNIKRPVMWMMVAFVLGEVAAYQMGMTVWLIVWIIAVLLALAIKKTAEGRVKPDFQTGAGCVCFWKAPVLCRVFLLFFCFLAGCGRMGMEMRPDALERMVMQENGSAHVGLSGTLDSISEKNGWCTLILKEVEIADEATIKEWEKGGSAIGREKEKDGSEAEREEGRGEAKGRSVVERGGEKDQRSSRRKKEKTQKVGRIVVSVKKDVLLYNIDLEESAKRTNESAEVQKVSVSELERSGFREKEDKKVLPPCGSRIQLTGTAEFLEEARNPGQFSYRMYYRGLGIRNRVTADRIFIFPGKTSPLRRRAERFRSYAKDVFQEICDPQDVGIFQAVLLGDKSGLSEELREHFQDNGIAHILAVSGLHVSLIGMSVYGILRFIGVSYGWAGLAASAILTFYGFVTGFGASVFRAVFMVELSCLAAYLGRSYDLLSALSLSLILQAWQSPYLLFSAGLQLSYGAVAAIGLETERMKRRKKECEKEKKEEKKEQKEKCWDTAQETIQLSTAIQLYTLPIQLYHYFVFPLLGILLNLIVIPLLAYAAGSGLLALGIYSVASSGENVLGKLWNLRILAERFSCLGGAAASGSENGISCISEGIKLLAGACTGPGHYIFQLYEWLCVQVERLPFHLIVAGQPELWKIAIFYAVLGVRYVWYVWENSELNFFSLQSARHLKNGILEKNGAEWDELEKNLTKGRREEETTEKNGWERDCFKQKVRDTVVTGTAVLFLFFQPVHGFQVCFLDVGQGDGVLLRTRNAVILSDCGSSQDKKIGKNVLEPFLKSQGICTLDWIFVSHADADHTNGIEWLLKEDTNIRVRHLALPAAGKGQKAYEKIETLARERGCEVYYLHRGETIQEERLSMQCLYPEADEKPAEERNSHSLVFDVTYGTFSMLLTGDIGTEEEREILFMEEMEGSKKEAKEKRQRVTLLKAAHHGSNGSSSTDFLEYFMPAFTVLSYGEGNTYGHPAPEAVGRLEQVETEIWRTAESGAVSVWTDGKRMKIKGYKEDG